MNFFAHVSSQTRKTFSWTVIQGAVWRQIVTGPDTRGTKTGSKYLETRRATWHCHDIQIVILFLGIYFSRILPKKQSKTD